MKVKFTRNTIVGGTIHREGATADVTDDRAKTLVTDGLATDQGQTSAAPVRKAAPAKVTKAKPAQ